MALTRAFIFRSLFQTAVVVGLPLQALAVPSIRFNVDGAPFKPSAGSKGVPSSAQKIVFYPENHPGVPASDFFRIRYQLEGFDSDWKQIDGGSDNVTICFYDERGNRFGQKNFEVKGKSAGWNEDIEKVAFTRRLESIIVPAEAKTVSLVFSSAGSPASVGVYLIKNVRISRKPTAADTTTTVLDGDAAIPSAKQASMTGPLWRSDGTRPSMAKIIDLNPNRVLAIVDEDSKGHAEWSLLQATAPKVTPGETLTVEWEEAYENAVGEPTPVTYNHLPPGRYKFVVQEVDVWGKAIGPEISSGFSVQTPYWKKTWFWGGLAAVANGFLILAAYCLIRINARRHRRRVRLLEQERLRIAQDLHDDLGARLTYLSLLSSNAGNRVSAPEDRESFREFSLVTRDIVTALSETVWTVDPKNDHLESLVGFLCRMITTQCKVSNMRCRIDALALTDRRPVSSEVRHHIVLAVKEAVNNAIKHSGSEELHARIGFDPPLLRITIADQGLGLAADGSQQGNGLGNMERRMAAVKGGVSLKSQPGEGTAVYFEIPIP